MKKNVYGICFICGWAPSWSTDGWVIKVMSVQSVLMCGFDVHRHHHCRRVPQTFLCLRLENLSRWCLYSTFICQLALAHILSQPFICKHLVSVQIGTVYQSCDCKSKPFHIRTSVEFRSSIWRLTLGQMMRCCSFFGLKKSEHETLFNTMLSVHFDSSVGRVEYCRDFQIQ